MIDVSYMTHMGCDNLVTDAARVSFNKQADQYGDNQNERLINFLAREKHYHPFSHSDVQLLSLLADNLQNTKSVEHGMKLVDGT